MGEASGVIVRLIGLLIQALLSAVQFTRFFKLLSSSGAFIIVACCYAYSILPLFNCCLGKQRLYWNMSLLFGPPLQLLSPFGPINAEPFVGQHIFC